MRLRQDLLLALLESTYALDWHESAIKIAKEGIDACPDIARFYHLLAKSILAMHNLLEQPDPNNKQHSQ